MAKIERQILVFSIVPIEYQKDPPIPNCTERVPKFDRDIGVDKPLGPKYCASGLCPIDGLANQRYVGYDDLRFVNLVEDYPGQVRAAGDSQYIVIEMKRFPILLGGWLFDIRCLF